MVHTLKQAIANLPPVYSEDQQQLYAEDLAHAKNSLRAIAQGLTGNWADELEARARALGTDQNYEDIRNQIRKEYKQYSEEYPGQSTMFELAGGALPFAFTGGAAAAPKGAGFLSKLVASPTARSAAVGAGQGVVSGAGAAQEMEDIPVEAANYGVLGGVMGAAVPNVVRGATGALSTIKNYFMPDVEKKTAQILEKAVQRTGMTPQELLAKIEADRKAGVTSSTLGSTSDELQALAEKVAGRGGEPAKALDLEAERTLAYQPGKVRLRVKNDLQAGEHYQDLDKTVKSLRSEAPKWYEEAYSHGEVTDPEVLKFLKLPQFRQGLNEAEKLLAAEGRKLPTVTLYNDEGKKIGERVAPTVEVLDQVKRGLDSLIEKETDAITGKSTSLGNVYKNKKNEFLEALDNAVPKYGEARKKYGDEMEVINAFNAGKKDFSSMDHEEIKKYYDGLSDAAKAAARTGYARSIFDKIDKAAQGGTSTAKIVSGPYAESKLAPLFESPEKFDLFKAAMEREAELHKQASKLLSASERGSRATAESALTDNTGNVGQAAVQAATGHPLAGGKSLMHNVATAVANPGLNDDVASELTKHLLSKEPKEVAAAVKLIEDYSANAEQAFKDRGRRELMGVSGVVAAAPPPEEGGD